MAVERRLLIVDDDERVRFVLSRALQGLSAHYEILAAGDAAEAMRLVEQSAFDLMITDINLPGTNGVTLTEELLKTSPSTAVVWITAYGCYRMSEKSVYNHIYACLEKPVGISEIREIALKALRERDREQFGRTRVTAGARNGQIPATSNHVGLVPGPVPG